MYELARTALLGTEHHSLSEATLQKLQAEGLDPSQPQAQLLAAAAAMMAQVKKAGFPLEKMEGQLPAPFGHTDEATCSLRSAEHLRLILDGKYAPALPEFMANLLENGRCLPTEHLPALLQRPDLNEWWPLFAPALGERGKWLLRQHPQWQRLVEDPATFSWQTGSRDERLRLLRHLSRTNPKEALRLLDTTWETEKYPDKAAFLGELAEGLPSSRHLLAGDVDEVFLQKCLVDSRKEVRAKTVELLTLLPDSAFGERMFERAKSCLQWHSGSLEVNLPEEPDEAALADGILKIHPAWKGAKAGYLGQVVAAVPPSLWEITWDLPPADILQKFGKSDWSGPLLHAVAMAAVRYGDAVWSELLLKTWLDDEHSPLWHEPVGGQLLEAATAEAVHRLAMDFFEKNSGLPGDDTPVFQLFLQNDAPWEDALALLLADRFRLWLRQTKQPDWTSFHYKELLKMLSYRCQTELYEKLQTGWDANVPLWAFWEKPVQEMLEVVFFRREMKNQIQIQGSNSNSKLPD